MSVEITIGDFLSGILPSLQTNRSFPGWPPDCFALCLALLKRTGAYTQLFLDWPPSKTSEDPLDEWTAGVSELAGKWRSTWQLPFNDLATDWQRVCDCFAHPLDSVRQNRPLLEALIKLVAVADEASESVGTPRDGESESEDEFLDSASALLETRNTLCKEIDPNRLRVLPRMHTPQNGLTDRSLSLYLSLCDSSEVVPRWLSTPFIQYESFNLLIVPWPPEVLVRHFRDVTSLAPSQLPDDFGFFNYDSSGADLDLAERVQALFAEAKRKLGRIDGVLLPELAITDCQFRALRKSLPSECFLVSGIGSGPTTSQRGRNEVRLSFPPLEDVVQRKHHPWKLTRGQVIQYGLGGVLSPSREWWEFGDFTNRQLSFISMSADLVLSVLVCEDLARPDPVANMVRAVGPNLVIALLMDGPQIKERWSARYANVLADDPGCSVLSFTSIGMALLSRPQSGPSRSRIVAMWKDVFSSATEIELPIGYDAVAISLSIRYEEEYTADGRRDGASAAFPILSGVHRIKGQEPGAALLSSSHTR
jgi:predicted amidohydrolase